MANSWKLIAWQILENWSHGNFLKIYSRIFYILINCFKDYFEAPNFERPSYQIWLLFLLESASNTGASEHKDMINWTATYRHDSDIPTPYAKYFPFGDLQNSKLLPLKNYSQGKTKKVAWFVSNCGARNKRLEYAQELQKYIQVDIYGS